MASVSGRSGLGDALELLLRLLLPEKHAQIRSVGVGNEPSSDPSATCSAGRLKRLAQVVVCWFSFFRGTHKKVGFPCGFTLKPTRKGTLEKDTPNSGKPKSHTV